MTEGGSSKLAVSDLQQRCCQDFDLGFQSSQKRGELKWHSRESRPSVCKCCFDLSAAGLKLYEHRACVLGSRTYPETLNHLAEAKPLKSLNSSMPRNEGMHRG